MSQDNLQTTTDESAFVKLLGTEGRVRILDVLLRKPHVTLTRAEIAELAGIDPTTFDRNKEILRQLGLLNIKNLIGHTTENTINTDSHISKVLGTARSELLEHATEPRNHRGVDQNKIKKAIKSRTDGNAIASEADAQIAKQLARERAY